MQLIFGELRVHALQRALSMFEVRGSQLWAGRSLIAGAELLTLLLTPYSALMQSVAGAAPAPHCAGVRAIGAYCLMKNAPHWVPTMALVSILIAILAGVLPAIVGWLHVWVAFSIASAIALLDGGDQAAVVFLILVAVVNIADDRRYGLDRRRRRLSALRIQIALAGLFAIRIQVAMIYFDSGIGKVFANDWVTGTAEYYVIRDLYFGASGPVASVMMALTSNTFVVVSLTWGAIVLEVAIAVLILCGPHSRKFALIACSILHGAIIVTIGLWSFGLIMIGGVAIAAIATSRRDPGSRPIPPAIERRRLISVAEEK